MLTNSQIFLGVLRYGKKHNGYDTRKVKKGH